MTQQCAVNVAFCLTMVNTFGDDPRKSKFRFLRFLHQMPVVPWVGLTVYLPPQCEDGDLHAFSINEISYDVATGVLCCDSESDIYEENEYPGMFAQHVEHMLGNGWIEDKS